MCVCVGVSIVVRLVGSSLSCVVYVVLVCCVGCTRFVVICVGFLWFVGVVDGVVVVGVVVVAVVVGVGAGVVVAVAFVAVGAVVVNLLMRLRRLLLLLVIGVVGGGVNAWCTILGHTSPQKKGGRREMCKEC